MGFGFETDIFEQQTIASLAGESLRAEVWLRRWMLVVTGQFGSPTDVRGERTVTNPDLACNSRTRLGRRDFIRSIAVQMSLNLQQEIAEMVPK